MIIIKAVATPILVGAVLLMLPWASRSGHWTDPVTALFMATSAMCVTGHTVVDPGAYFSLFGQLVLLALAQIGGLGFMTLALFLLTLAGRRLSLQNETMMMDSLRVDEAGEIKTLLIRAVIFTVLVELVGAGIIAWRLTALQGMPFSPAIYYGLFHSICAFCNAGLSLFPNNMIGLRTDKIVLSTVMILIVAGGMGFLVLQDLYLFRFWRRNRLERGSLSLHSKVTIGVSLALLLSGGLAVAILEWNNTLQSLPISDRLTCSLFQSVTARTCGFNVVDMAQTHASTRFATMVLMFIGGSPGSTAGGIKTTTVAVLIFTMIAMVRGRREIVMLGRTIAVQVVEKSISIFLLGIAVVLLLFGMLLLTEEASLATSRFTCEALMFETVSAFGTVGLSTGIMPILSTLGKLVIILCMFIGRVGPLTMALVVGSKESRQMLHYPEEDVMIG